MDVPHSQHKAIVQSCLHLEMSQQLTQCLPILRRIFPVDKLSDMPILLNVCYPSFRTSRSGSLQKDRHNDEPLTIALFMTSNAYFVIHPVAIDGVSRKNNEQLVAVPYRFIDLHLEFIPGAQRFGSKPALYPFPLQIVVQLL